MLLGMKRSAGRDKKLALVIGEDTRSFLSVIRSLGRAGFSVHVVCFDRKSPALKSTYIDECFYYNYQSASENEWLDNVQCLIERYDYAVVFPCDERSIYPLWSIRQQIPSTCQLAIANELALDVLFDKWKTKQLAKSCNVNVAPGELVSLSNADHAVLTKTFGGRYVIKPLQSFSEKTLSSRNKVAIVGSECDLEAFKHSNPTDEMYLVESFFEGKGEGLSVFSWKGEVKAAFGYKRLAEPHSGGGSSYRIATPVDDDQLQAVAEMCRETNLSGLAMFEFRRNKNTNDWILVEVNARVWGGLPLAEAASVDFPAMYVEYLLGNEYVLSQKAIFRKVTARALTSDLYEVKREGELMAQQSGRHKARTHTAKRLLSYAKVFTPSESIDSLRLDDPAPFFSELKLITGEIGKAALAKNRYVSRYRRWKARQKFKRLLGNQQNIRINFLCYGNIIRSPFAEKYLRRKLTGSEMRIDVDSWGLHHREDRNSPDIAITAAKMLGCDLENHRSKWLTQKDVMTTDVIIYFDEKNRAEISSRYKIHHAFCAADFMSDHFPALNEIEDPYESDVKTIKGCYDKIANALDNVVAIYKGVKA